MKHIDDYLSLLKNDEEDEVLTGTYYKIKPITANDTGKEFSYDVVEDASITWGKLLDTLQANSSVVAIKTNDACGFKINGYVALQEGGLYQISNIIKRYNKTNKQALRFLKQTIDVEYVIRLYEVDNPMELK